MGAGLNGDSSIRERIAQRDARVARARELLRRARTEQERGDAVCEELDAKLEFEEGVARWARWPAPALAAMVKIGRLSAEEALAVCAVVGPPQAHNIASELVAALGEQELIALATKHRSIAVYLEDALKRAIERRDREGTERLLSASDPWLGVIIEAALTFGRDVLRSQRSKWQQSVEALASNDTRPAAIEARARWALTLEPQEFAVVAEPILQQIEGWATLNTSDSETAALIDATSALLFATSVDRLIPFVRSALERPGHVEYCIGPARTLLRTSKALSLPEQHARLEELVLDWARRRAFGLVDEVFFEPTGPRRQQLERRVQMRFAAGEEVAENFVVLRRTQRSRWWKTVVEQELSANNVTEFALRWRRDESFANAILAWAPKRRYAEQEREFERLLLDAAREGNEAAIDALTNWESPATITTIKRFFDGLPEQLVESLLDRSTFAAHEVATDQQAASLLAAASEEQRISLAQLTRTLDVQLLADDPSTGLRAHIARRFRQWIVDELSDKHAPESSNFVLPMEIACVPQLDDRVDAALEHAGSAALRRWIGNGLLESDDAARRTAVVCACWISREAMRVLVECPWDRVSTFDATSLLVRCEQLDRQSTEPALEAIRAAILARLRNNTSQGSLNFAQRVCEDRSPTALRAAIDELLGRGRWLDCSDARACTALGVANEVLLAGAERATRWHPTAFSFLLEAATDTVRARAIEAFRAEFRARDHNRFDHRSARWLSEREIIEKWEQLVGARVQSLLEPSLLRCVGGQALIDRVAERTAQWLSRERGTRDAQ